jgi:hypothetical protein
MRSATVRALSAVFLAVIMAAPSLHAQLVMGPAPVAPNAVFLEVGGPGGFYSANYDLLLNSALSVRAGATSWSTTSFDKQGEKLTAAIIGAAVRFDISQFVDRQEGRFLEVGAALSTGTYSRSSYDTIVADGPFTTLVPMIGIRYQPPRGGFMYRATFTPYVPLSGGMSQYPQEGVRAGASLSAGYAF